MLLTVYAFKRCIYMARGSEAKFLIIAIPLLLLTIVVLLAQPLFVPGMGYRHYKYHLAS